ncbi:MAG: DUF4097 family beta strand repeat protein [Gemmatimonadaceae bacterium]|nr:DUF4097 family beta strand repeat protein [Gemmatimonadaceae bacterium]
MKTTTLPLLLATLAIASSARAQNIVGRADRTFTHSARIGAGDDVRIFAPQGTITVTEGSGNTIEYRAEKVRGDAEDIGFIVRPLANGITICAVYDEDDECNDDGVRSNRRRTWRSGNNRARVEVTVSVPAGTRLRVSSGSGDVSVTTAATEARVASGNGKVRVNGIRGRVEVSSGNGAVTVDDVTGPVSANSGNGDVSIGTVNGPVSASSGNGDILVSMDRLTGTGDLEFTSGNGRIEVTVPTDFSAEVQASTGNGRITTDFPIQLVGRISPTRLRGTIGDGRRKLTMTTGNGSMEIRKGAR